MSEQANQKWDKRRASWGTIIAKRETASAGVVGSGYFRLACTI